MCQNSKSCLLDPCQNGGACSQVTNTLHTCSCSSQFTGNRCQYNDPCRVTPCLNAGVCTLTFDGSNRVCSCVNSWTSDDCSIAGGCNPTTPCMSGGTCVHDISTGSFVRCDCLPGYVGSFCQDRLACQNGPCLNGGACVDDATTLTYTCNCLSTYVGMNCQYRK
eukprot:XP_003731873.1 PREDICTED: fibropellin-3 [Strongylocentrotus purpuratus]